MRALHCKSCSQMSRYLLKPRIVREEVTFPVCTQGCPRPGCNHGVRGPHGPAMTPLSPGYCLGPGRYVAPEYLYMDDGMRTYTRERTVYDLYSKDDSGCVLVEKEVPIS